MSAMDHLPTHRGSPHSSRHSMPPSRQPHRELGERANFAVDRDRAAVLLGYDLIADRQAKPRALASRLGREERLEQFVPVFRRNADTIVTNPNLDAFAKVARRDLKDRAETAIAPKATLAGGIEAIAYQVKKHASQFLRHRLNGCEIAVQLALQRYVEALILSPSTVIGEVQRLLDERV